MHVKCMLFYILAKTLMCLQLVGLIVQLLYSIKCKIEKQHNFTTMTDLPCLSLEVTRNIKSIDHLVNLNDVWRLKILSLTCLHFSVVMSSCKATTLGIGLMGTKSTPEGKTY